LKREQPWRHLIATRSLSILDSTKPQPFALTDVKGLIDRRSRDTGALIFKVNRAKRVEVKVFWSHRERVGRLEAERRPHLVIAT
jgi:hypothetical protein